MANIPDIWRDFDRPVSVMGSLRPLLRELDDLMSTTLSTPLLTDDARTMVPNVDIEETDDHYIMSFDMPGIDKENIDVEVQGNLLKVIGESRGQRDEGDRKSRMSRREFRKFQRIVSLPDSVEAGNVEAQYRNGVLTIALPKAARAKRQKVQIGDAKGGILSRLLGDGGTKKNKGSIDVKASDAPEGAASH